MAHTKLRLRQRRGFLAVVALLAASISTSYAASWAVGLLPSTSPARAGVPSDDRAIAHALSRIAFGARPGDIERVRRIGLATYIDQQLNPAALPDEAMTARLARFRTLGLSTAQLSEEYFQPALLERRARRQTEQNTGSAPPSPEMQPGMDATAAPPGTDPAGPAPSAAGRPERRGGSAAMRTERLVLSELAQQKLLRATYSDRQLEEVMVDFWFNHFNVFAGKGVDRVYLTSYERDAIRPRVMGRFRDLLGAVAESPAMLFYLDNWMSADPNGTDRRNATRPGLGGRRTLGQGRVGQRAPAGRAPNPDADPAAPGQPLPGARARGLNENYARELMELHTLGVDGGYTQADIGEVARAFTGWTLDRPRQGGEFRFEARVHDDRQKVVLGQVLAAGGGKRDGEQVLDILARHPSTARFIATKLVRRFVSDTPPEPLVARAAARFRDTDGDIKEVVRTIVTSPEFFAPEAYRAKVKTPLEFVVSALRATDARVTEGQSLVMALRQLGMPLYFAQPPTGYVDRPDAWVNTGALLNRMNFAVALVGNELRGVRVAIGDSATSRVTDETRQRVLDTILRNDVSDATRSTLAKAADAGQLAALAIGSPEFQKR